MRRCQQHNRPDTRLLCCFCTDAPDLLQSVTHPVHIALARPCVDNPKPCILQPRRRHCDGTSESTHALFRGFRVRQCLAAPPWTGMRDRTARPKRRPQCRLPSQPATGTAACNVPEPWRTATTARVLPVLVLCRVEWLHECTRVRIHVVWSNRPVFESIILSHRHMSPKSGRKRPLAACCRSRVNPLHLSSSSPLQTPYHLCTRVHLLDQHKQ
jgi:hypothetical protein